MKNRPLQKSIKTCAILSAASLYAAMGNTYAHTINARHAWVAHSNKIALNTPVANFARITGVVTDETDLPLPGATVTIKGTATSSITDVNGRYNIEADANATLVFSFIGRESQEVALNGRTTLNIKLLPSAKDLNEVVVIGYGTRQVKDVTGAITSVKADKFQNEHPQSVTDVLRGSVPGISVALNTSPKGGGVGDLQIRGRNSLSGSTNPLLVLDGVIYPGDLA